MQQLSRALSASVFTNRAPMPMPTSRLVFHQTRLLSDDTRKRALEAIAKVERSSGEVTLADASAMVEQHQHTKSSKHAEAPGGMVDFFDNPLRGPPRFPLDAAIECFLGEEKGWVVGTVVSHYYRQVDWPENRRAPYQVKIEGEGGRTIFVPLDRDECVRTTLRFPVRTIVECFLGEDHGWVEGTVVAHYHREPSWDPIKWVPYQIKLEDGQGGTALIFAPVDNDSCVRAII